VVAYVKTELITENVVTEIYKTKVSEALTTKPKVAELQTCQQLTLRQIRERAETKNATKLLTFNYNNMKTILDKINKADEIQANKVELGKHEVELAIVDDIKKLQITANKSEDTALNELKKGISILENASKAYLNARDNANLVIKEIDKARGMSKQLGIDLPANIEALANYYGKSIGENLQMSNKINQFVSNTFK
jgi:hypothetical protein